MTFIRIQNSIIDKDKVVYICQDEKNVNKITVSFDNGERLEFTGSEAMELWKEFDKGGWRDEG